jgi:hypothetical protein
MQVIPTSFLRGFVALCESTTRLEHQLTLGIYLAQSHKGTKGRMA